MPPGTESSSVTREAMFGDQQVRADDARHLVLQGRRALKRDQVGGLALVQPAGDPFGLFAFHALAVKQIDRAIELKQHAAERFHLLRQAGPSGKGAGDVRQS